MKAGYDGFVTMVTVERGEESPRFRARILRNNDSAGAAWYPTFDRATAEAVVRWTNDVYAVFQDDASARAEWSGDTVLVTYVTGTDESGADTTHVDRYEPDENGRYAIGRNVWEWEDVTDDK